ncbi:MAG: SGNH/GDSL hydrolase family protein, partial [Candidatus Omnitrophica bacterium]|nr:SGNH/GDSL hydrolase family protein [Candidatus Omnitrophota bacterium]
LPPVYQQTPYGWSVKENTEEKARIEDSPGHFRNITVKYYRHGFKRWGDVQTEKKKIFIIGDSFTQMNWVSNGEEWYSSLEKEFDDVELFVFGGGGYGSLQEFMILDDYFDVIDPDLILWQFCGNDYWNNLYELDRSMYPFNNHFVRPYLENGGVVYRLPLPLSTLRNYSFTADRVLSLYDRYRSRQIYKDLDNYVRKRKISKQRASNAEKERERRLEREAYSVTHTILGKVKKRVGDVPVYMINASGEWSEQEQKLCDENKLICIKNVVGPIYLKSQQGYEIKVVNNGHWNRLGNELVGQELVNKIKSENQGQTPIY